MPYALDATPVYNNAQKMYMGASSPIYFHAWYKIRSGPKSKERRFVIMSQFFI
jgi:hypothetical protein